MADHPARRKAQLRAYLSRHRVATHVQLARADLLEPADWLDLPRLTLTCQTRTTQEHSSALLTYYALASEGLNYTARELTHAATLTEARLRAGELPDGRWKQVTSAGRTREHLPDAEIVFRGRERSAAWAVEADLGYTKKRREQKLRAFAEQGYGAILWATSVHARVGTVAAEARELQECGWLPGVKIFESHFVDFWTEGRDPYGPRPRCAKPNYVHWSTWA